LSAVPRDQARDELRVVTREAVAYRRLDHVGPPRQLLPHDRGKDGQKPFL
jgi:hypothetical protein